MVFPRGPALSVIARGVGLSLVPSLAQAGFGGLTAGGLLVSLATLGCNLRCASVMITSATYPGDCAMSVLAADTTKTSSDANSAEAVERALRVQLAAAYRLVEYFGWSELIYGHLTVRIPGEPATFLINLYGLSYDEITASNLVRIDVDGNVVGPSQYPVSRAGFVIHSAVHMARGVNKCVMHTHTRSGMAISALECGLQQVHMYSTGYYQRVAYHDYEGPSLDTDERTRLLADLGDHSAMILRNHGLMTVGRTVPEAFIRLYRLERAAQVQLDAMSAGKVRVLEQSVAAASAEGIDAFLELEDEVGALEFAALQRKLDKIDPSYRD
jgi:ribulose-5-phosphate 4-epimerase/fuculose-1-phosphate aldolase